MNRRNRTSSKTMRSSKYGEVPLAVPRDRKDEFEPTIIKKNQTSFYGLKDQIIAIYTKRLSTRDIQDQFADLYDAEVSPTLISNVTYSIKSDLYRFRSND
ncbi:TPA: transposase [Enterococcus faecalis]|nr:transposase [Enterococcus faecalis]HBI3768694.1 transposase [Enterococcus faecalis]